MLKNGFRLLAVLRALVVEIEFTIRERRPSNRRRVACAKRLHELADEVARVAAEVHPLPEGDQ